MILLLNKHDTRMGFSLQYMNNFTVILSIASDRVNTITDPLLLSVYILHPTLLLPIANAAFVTNTPAQCRVLESQLI